jgi:ribosomal protein S18 acetylase RimI-like enzyme
MMNTVTVRPARADDKDAVLAFTQKTWDWGDYIHHVWDDWLNAPDGELVVAEMSGQPVAIAMTTIIGPGEGWLQGLRVHPEYRRHGLARDLTEHHIGCAPGRALPQPALANARGEERIPPPGHVQHG